MKTPATETLKALRRSGYTVRVVEGKLKVRGQEEPPEELTSRILKHRNELVRLVEEDVIVDELEVFELAGELFGNRKEGAA